MPSEVGADQQGHIELERTTLLLCPKNTLRCCRQGYPDEWGDDSDQPFTFLSALEVRAPAGGRLTALTVASYRAALLSYSFVRH